MNDTPLDTKHTTGSPGYDVYLVGVGGQGVLTIGEIIAETAHRKGLPVNFYPTKGMAQRGGFVKAQLRLGRETVGGNISEASADLAVSMELSEALKAVRFIKPGGELLLFGHVWAPLAVMLGKAEYPSIDQVQEQVQGAEATLHHLSPESLPIHEDVSVPANVFVLGAALGRTRLGDVLDPSDVREVISTRWKRGIERNLVAFQAGLDVLI
jgi:indolepyruvate ferredoxin oxidoreductase beta subunit